MCVCVCLSLSLYLCGLLYACMPVCVHSHIQCVCMCVSMHKWTCGSMLVHGRTHAHIYACMCTSVHFFYVSVYANIFACICASTCVHICAGLCMRVHLSDVRQVRLGRRSCWRARTIDRVRKDRPMRTTRPPRTVAASLPSFTLSASTCSVPFW